MIIKVHPHKVEIVKTPVNEQEVNITECNFDFDEEFEGLTKDAYFTLNGNSYTQLIQNNKCTIPSEVLVEKGSVELGVVAYEVEDEELIKRYNPSPDYFDTWSGSLKENAENSVPITPTDKEQIEALVQEVQDQMDNLDIEAEKVDKTTTITITHKDGTTEEVEIFDGLDGAKGDKGDKGDAGAIKMIIVAELPSTGADDTIYLVPAEDTETGNNYDEYVYVNNAWEKLGGIQVQVDLTDYVKNTDYASSSKGGVIKTSSSYGTDITNQGVLIGYPIGYGTYQNINNYCLISKGTLENVITGKGLVSNTDYAGSGVSGVITASGSYGVQVNQTNGVMTATTKSYTDYTNGYSNMFISKGTLENVLTATIGDISSVIDAINGESI